MNIIFNPNVAIKLSADAYRTLVHPSLKQVGMSQAAWMPVVVLKPINQLLVLSIGPIHQLAKTLRRISVLLRFQRHLDYTKE